MGMSGTSPIPMIGRQGVGLCRPLSVTYTSTVILQTTITASMRARRCLRGLFTSQILLFSINTSYRATPHLLLFSNIASQHVDSEIFNSPLVDESQLTSATFGFAYVMAMTTGRSPWTSEELLRFGIGFGFSYASEVPYVEQVKQAKREQNTSHFLNYLEGQFDVPLRLMFENKAVRNCYVGISLLHRSGIFAKSDILSNVSGGSDMVSGHIECKR